MKRRGDRKGKLTIQKPTLGALMVILAVVFLISCSQQPKYFTFQLIHPSGWSTDSLCTFNVDIEDNHMYNLSIKIRHIGTYPYENLWLFVEQLSPDNHISHDTVYCVMADYTGRWFGKGAGSVYTLTVPFKQHYKFNEHGTYRYSIVHGMRDDNLIGINAIGLKLEVEDGEK